MKTIIISLHPNEIISREGLIQGLWVLNYSTECLKDICLFFFSSSVQTS